MFDVELVEQAAQLLELCRQKKLMIATAESCTGGLIAALFTEIAGSSDVFERGFVTYSNEAKQELLGVPSETINHWGAVSPQTAQAMARGALQNARVNLSIAVTGIAGPGGGSTEKPVGLVYLASAIQGGLTLGKECRFGDMGRSNVRKATVQAALKLMKRTIGSQNDQADDRP